MLFHRIHNLRDRISYFICVVLLRRKTWWTKIFGYWTKVDKRRTIK